MEIKRDFYLNKLNSRKGNGLVKVVTGVTEQIPCHTLFLLEAFIVYSVSSVDRRSMPFLFATPSSLSCNTHTSPAPACCRQLDQAS